MIGRFLTYEPHMRLGAFPGVFALLALWEPLAPPGMQMFSRLQSCSVVMPGMHCAHHSVFSEETTSNFRFIPPWRDRLFGTRKNQPSAGHEGMIAGIEQFRDADDLRPECVLVQPFNTRTEDYMINRAQDASSP